MEKDVKKASVTKTYHTSKGTLYKGSKVKVEETNTETLKMRVTDEVGRIFWIERQHVKLV